MTEQELIDADIIDGVKSFEHYWPQIRDYFDFEKVAKVMAFLNWGWTMHNGMEKGKAIPDANFLIETIYERCKEVYSKGYGSVIDTGGFRVSFDEDGLFVEFTLESWNAE